LKEDIRGKLKVNPGDS